MGFAPVALGTPEQSASGSGITGLAFGAPPTAGNLLVCWWAGQGVAGIPTKPSGWTNQPAKSGTSMTVVIYTKIAAGGDAVPAFAAITGVTQTAQLAEFSGNTASAVADQTGQSSFPITTSPLTATFGAADTQLPGELVLYAGGVFHSAALTDSMSTTVNSAAGNDVTNNSTSTADHYCFGYGVTTSDASPDSVALSHSTTSVTGAALTAASFKFAVFNRTAQATLAPHVGLTATGRVHRTGHATLASKVGLTATGVSKIVPKLVGSFGTPVQAAAGSAISGLAYGQSPTAGNLLVCYWVGQGATGVPTKPTGWTNQAAKNGTSTTALVYTKVATGGDTVPAFASIAGVVQSVALAEFSGVGNVLDQGGNTSFPLTSPMAATFGAADQRAGELVIYVASILHSAAVTDSAVGTVNGTTAVDHNNNATSTVDHYDFGYAVTASNASADAVSLSFNATSVTGVSLEAYSFKWAGSVQSASAHLSPVATLGLTATATSIVVGAKGSPATLAATLGLSASASVVGAGPGSTGQASLSATGALHATGSVFDPPKHGQATLAVTAALTARGKVVHRAHATLASTLGFSARGVAARHAHATLAGSLSLAATCHVARHAHATLASTLAFTATGVSAQPDLGTAVLHTTLAFHASGRLHHVGHGTLAPVLALSAKGHVTRGAHAGLSATLALTAQARKRESTGAGFFAHLALASTARVQRVDAVVLNVVLGLNATAVVGTTVLLGQITLTDDTLALITLTDED